MKVASIEIIHIEIPLKRPFETSFGRIDRRPSLIVRMRSDDGTTGIGESSVLSVPMSEPETTASGYAFLKEYAPSLLGAEVCDGFDVTALYPHDSHPVTRIGFESAYLDLLARSKGITLAGQFGASRKSVELGESASLRDSFDEVAAEVAEFIEQGIRRIKIKIAPGRDVALVEHLTKRFPGRRFGVDANAVYTSADVPLLARLAAYDVLFVEQPFSPEDLDSHAALRSRGIPVCLDESVGSLADCERALEKGACDLINIKPARIGSFAESRRIYDVCTAARIRLFGGGRLETGIGKSTNAAFYALEGFNEASDITPPSEYLESDIISPAFGIQDGGHPISDGPGLGVSIDEEKLRAYERDRVEIAR